MAENIFKGSVVHDRQLDDISSYRCGLCCTDSKKGFGADWLYSAFVFEASCGMKGKTNSQSAERRRNEGNTMENTWECLRNKKCPKPVQKGQQGGPDKFKLGWLDRAQQGNS